MEKDITALFCLVDDRNRQRFAGEVGNASLKTLKCLWHRISDDNNVKIVCTDGNPTQNFSKKNP